MQFPVPDQDIAAFLQGDFYKVVSKLVLDHRPADENDATLVVKVLLSTLPLNQNIDPQMLAETYIEIIRECLPSKLALSLARIHLRNTMTFAPAPKEFRDALLQSIRSLRDLKNPVLSLAENAKSTANVVGSSGRGRLNRYIEMGYPEEKLDDLNEPVEKPYEAGSDLSEFLISDT